MALIGWIIVTLLGILIIVSGVLLQYITAACAGRFEPICIGYFLVGGLLLWFSYSQCPFVINFL